MNEGITDMSGDRKTSTLKTDEEDLQIKTKSAAEDLQKKTDAAAVQSEGRKSEAPKGPVVPDNSGRLFSNKYLLKLLWPLFVEQFLLFAVGLLDSVMVASVGEAAVSAVSLVDSLMVLLITVFTAIATGGAVVVGQYLGQKKEENANKAADQLFISAFLLSLAIILVMYALRNQIISLVFGNIEQDVRHYCDVYYLIVMASVPFIALYNSGAALMRSVGDSKTSMTVSIIMNIINVVGNAILIYGLHRGVEGVAIPTLVSRMTAAAIMIFLLKNSERKVHLTAGTSLKPDWGYIKNIMKIGIPNGVENGMFQLGKIILLSMISGFGTVSIAANAVGNSVSTIAVLPGFAMNYGIVSVVSICIGAGDYEQVRFYVRKLMKWVYAGMFAMNVIIVLCTPLIIKIYNLSDTTGSLATKLIFFHSACAVVIWSAAFVIPYVLRAAGDVTFTMIVGVASMWIFRIGFAVVIAVYMGMGVMGVWVAMIIDWIVRAICFCIRYCSGKWKRGTVA